MIFFILLIRFFFFLAGVPIAPLNRPCGYAAPHRAACPLRRARDDAPRAHFAGWRAHGRAGYAAARVRARGARGDVAAGGGAAAAC